MSSVAGSGVDARTASASPPQAWMSASIQSSWPVSSAMYSSTAARSQRRCASKAVRSAAVAGMSASKKGMCLFLFVKACNRACVLGSNGLAPERARAIGEAITRREGRVGDDPPRHARVIGQGEIGGADGGSDARHGRGSARYHDRDIETAAFAEHRSLCDGTVGGERALHPLGRELAAVRRRIGGLFAAGEIEITIEAEVAEITGRPFLARRWAAEITGEEIAAHDDLTVIRDAYLDVRQRAADAADASLIRKIEAHYRRRLGETVTLIHRQTQLAGLHQQGRGNRRAAHGDEAQRARPVRALRDRLHQRLQ